MNGHTQDVLDYLAAPIPDEAEWQGDYNLGTLCDGLPLSNCCNVPPAYGQTPEETDYCSKCGEHCEFEEE